MNAPVNHSIFQKNAHDVTGDPVLMRALNLDPDHQTTVNERDRAALNDERVMEENMNDPTMAGFFIDNLQKKESLPSSEESLEEDKKNIRHMRMMLNMDASIKSMMSKLDKIIDTKSAIHCLAKQQGIEWDEHVKAGREVTVGPEDVLIVNGQVATRKQIEAYNNKTGECFAGKAREDLVLDENGVPIKDASGINYFDKDAQARMDEALGRAQDNADYMDKLQSGEITFADLPDDKKIEILSIQPENVRQKLYADAGLSAEEISLTESLIAQQAQPTGILHELKQPAYKIEEMNVSFSGEALTESFGNAAFLKPMESQPLIPIIKPSSPALIPTS